MYYKQKYIESIESLKSNINGLTNEEAKKRLSEYGYNELKEGNKVPNWKLFLESFKDPLVIILLIAAIVQIFLGEVIESIITSPKNICTIAAIKSIITNGSLKLSKNNSY